MRAPAPNRLSQVLVAGVAALFAVVAWVATRPAAREATPPIPLTQPNRQAVAKAAGMAVDYLVRHCDSSGKFAYRVHVNGKPAAPDEYNIVRHGGAMYALGMYQEWRTAPEVERTLVRSGHFLKGFIGPAGKGGEYLAVWSQPNGTKNQTAVLGGAGLGLAGLVSAERAHPGTTSRKDLRRLGGFLLWMQRADGAFYSGYSARAGRLDKFKSLYYPGEAALGLIMLYDLDRQPQWLSGAAKALVFLARERAGQSEVPPDHWALIATRLVLKYLSDAPGIANREALVRHGSQICEAILIPRTLSGSQVSLETLISDGHTTPTATRLEGLFAALSFLPARETTLRARLETATGEGIDFLLRAQVQAGPCRGGIPGEFSPEFSTGVPSDATAEIRVDYVQHGLSAMLGYLGISA